MGVLLVNSHTHTQHMYTHTHTHEASSSRSFSVALTRTCRAPPASSPRLSLQSDGAAPPVASRSAHLHHTFHDQQHNVCFASVAVVRLLFLSNTIYAQTHARTHSFVFLASLFTHGHKLALVLSLARYARVCVCSVDTGADPNVLHAKHKKHSSAHVAEHPASVFPHDAWKGGHRYVCCA